VVGVPVGYTYTNVGKYQGLNFSGFMQMKQKSLLAALSAVILFTPFSSPVHALTQNETSPSGENTAVVVTPGFGAYKAPLIATMTPAEMRIINKAQEEVKRVNIVKPLSARLVTWYVEPSALNSPTVKLARKTLLGTQAMFEGLGIFEAKATSIVIGRTQKFLNETVTRLGCFPNLSRTWGQHLMGSSLCSDTIIVMNLSGYLFLTTPGQTVTREMETRPEPPIASQSYLLVHRNIAGLSHEWAHSVRTLMAGGEVPPGEPAWMREGFAEMVSGLARVKTFPLRTSYADFHAVKIHMFSNWASRCKLNLRAYAGNSDILAGCEYYKGLIGVEILLSDFGGLAKLMKLYKDTSVLRSFEASFLTNYGMTLPEFEVIADHYINDIAKIPFRT
jgi:hypothetical protein